MPGATVSIDVQASVQIKNHVSEQWLVSRPVTRHLQWVPKIHPNAVANPVPGVIDMPWPINWICQSWEVGSRRICLRIRRHRDLTTTQLSVSRTVLPIVEEGRAVERGDITQMTIVVGGHRSKIHVLEVSNVITLVGPCCQIVRDQGLSVVLGTIGPQRFECPLTRPQATERSTVHEHIGIQEACCRLLRRKSRDIHIGIVHHDDELGSVSP